MLVDCHLINKIILCLVLDISVAKCVYTADKLEFNGDKNEKIQNGSNFNACSWRSNGIGRLPCVAAGIIVRK